MFTSTILNRWDILRWKMAKAIVRSPFPPRSSILGGAERAYRIYYGLSCEHFPRRCASLPIVGCFGALIFRADCSLNVQSYHHSINRRIYYIFSGTNSFEKHYQKMKTNWKYTDNIQCRGVRKVSNCWPDPNLFPESCTVRRRQERRMNSTNS